MDGNNTGLLSCSLPGSQAATLAVGDKTGDDAFKALCDSLGDECPAVQTVNGVASDGGGEVVMLRAAVFFRTPAAQSTFQSQQVGGKTWGCYGTGDLGSAYTDKAPTHGDTHPAFTCFLKSNHTGTMSGIATTTTPAPQATVLITAPAATPAAPTKKKKKKKVQQQQQSQATGATGAGGTGATGATGGGPGPAGAGAVAAIGPTGPTGPTGAGSAGSAAAASAGAKKTAAAANAVAAAAAADADDGEEEEEPTPVELAKRAQAAIERAHVATERAEARHRHLVLTAGGSRNLNKMMRRRLLRTAASLGLTKVAKSELLRERQALGLRLKRRLLEGDGGRRARLHGPASTDDTAPATAAAAPTTTAAPATDATGATGATGAATTSAATPTATTTEVPAWALGYVAAKIVFSATGLSKAAAIALVNKAQTVLKDQAAVVTAFAGGGLTIAGAATSKCTATGLNLPGATGGAATGAAAEDEVAAAAAAAAAGATGGATGSAPPAPAAAGSVNATKALKRRRAGAHWIWVNQGHTKWHKWQGEYDGPSLSSRLKAAASGAPSSGTSATVQETAPSAPLAATTSTTL
eukprot:g1799.t1